MHSAPWKRRATMSAPAAWQAPLAPPPPVCSRVRVTACVRARASVRARLLVRGQVCACSTTSIRSGTRGYGARSLLINQSSSSSSSRVLTPGGDRFLPQQCCAERLQRSALFACRGSASTLAAAQPPCPACTDRRRHRHRHRQSTGTDADANIDTDADIDTGTHSVAHACESAQARRDRANACGRTLSWKGVRVGGLMGGWLSGCLGEEGSATVVIKHEVPHGHCGIPTSFRVGTGQRERARAHARQRG